MKIEDAIEIIKELTNEMEIEDAIKLLKRNIECEEMSQNADFMSRDCVMKTRANIYSYNLAIQALEKQIPKRPIIEPWNPALCPSCGTELSDFECDGYYTHWKGLTMCECGQALDWEELK